MLLKDALLGRKIIAYKLEGLKFSLATEDKDGDVIVVSVGIDPEEVTTYYADLEYEIEYPISVSGGWIIHKPDETQEQAFGNKE